MAILRKWGYVLKWPFWVNGGMVANSANSGAFYTILTNIWHPWWSWVCLHMEVQLELWEKFESNLLVCVMSFVDRSQNFFVVSYDCTSVGRCYWRNLDGLRLKFYYLFYLTEIAYVIRLLCEQNSGWNSSWNSLRILLPWTSLTNFWSEKF